MWGTIGGKKWKTEGTQEHGEDTWDHKEDRWRQRGNTREHKRVTPRDKRTQGETEGHRDTQGDTGT